ncbi:MAG: HEAT repeat domain-containing protein [Alphaproteobacteria bacterium]|nr:HEAT repeat domain-containing protein [Alphaproteobacteria bacterium]
MIIPRRAHHRFTLAALALAALAYAAALTDARPAGANGWEHGAIPFARLVEALQTGSAATRLRAAQSLGYRGQAEAAAPLLDALARPEREAEVRAAIYRALGAIGAVEAWPALNRCLEAEALTPVRAACAGALGGLRGTPRAADAGARLIGLIAPDEEPLVRRRAVAALGAVADAAAVATLARLAGAAAPVSDSRPAVAAALAADPTLAARAVDALGATGARAAGQALAELLTRAEDAATRLRLATALARIGAPEARVPLKRVLEEAEDPRLRVAATVALAAAGRAGDAADADGVRKRLADLLAAPERAVQYAAVTALRDIGDAESGAAVARYADALANWLAATDAGAIAEAPQDALERLTLLEAALRTATDLAPAAGLEAMARSAQARPIPRNAPHRLALADALYKVRRAALYGLGYTGAAERAGALLAGEVGLGAPDSRLRAVAARSIGVLGRPDAPRVLTAALRDEAAEVRWTAARTLGYLGERAALEPLIALFGDDDSRVRAAAATALADLGAVEAIPAIQRRAETEERPPAQAAAADALARLKRLRAVGAE